MQYEKGERDLVVCTIQNVLSITIKLCVLNYKYY